MARVSMFTRLMHKHKADGLNGDGINRGLPMAQVGSVAILFLLLWTIYFAAFHDVRLERGSTPDDWYHILSFLPVWLGAMIRYGLVVPLICATIFGTITSRNRLLAVFLSLLLLIAIFCAIFTVFEFVFEHRPVAAWKFDLIAFPVFSVFGTAMGRLFGKLIFKSN